MNVYCINTLKSVIVNKEWLVSHMTKISDAYQFSLIVINTEFRKQLKVENIKRYVNIDNDNEEVFIAK